MSTHATTLAAMQHEIENIKKHYVPTSEMIRWTVGVGIATVLSLTGIISGLMLTVSSQIGNIEQNLRDIRKESTELRKEFIAEHTELRKEFTAAHTEFRKEVTAAHTEFRKEVTQKFAEHSEKFEEQSKQLAELSKKMDILIASQKK